MVHVRSAEFRDLARLRQIAAHAATAAQWNPVEYENLFASTRAKSRTALVVEHNRAVEGFIVARQIDDEWEIENIAIHGPSRRLGLGTRLLGEFLDLVRERGGKQVFLEVRESNHAARALYEKWAFVESGRRKMYYHDPQEDAIVLCFSLL
jgi:[ribosomal protein S18]-alanine N-acetyltransferase